MSVHKLPTGVPDLSHGGRVSIQVEYVNRAVSVEFRAGSLPDSNDPAHLRFVDVVHGVATYAPVSVMYLRRTRDEINDLIAALESNNPEAIENDNR